MWQTSFVRSPNYNQCLHSAYTVLAIWQNKPALFCVILLLPDIMHHKSGVAQSIMNCLLTFLSKALTNMDTCHRTVLGKTGNGELLPSRGRGTLDYTFLVSVSAWQKNTMPPKTICIWKTGSTLKNVKVSAGHLLYMNVLPKQAVIYLPFMKYTL